MYNENNQIVSVFKDFLILDDLTEFLKRYYYKDEVATRLPKIFTFYSSAFPSYPNYAILPENKYMFKNISKKQKVLEDINNRRIAKDNDKVDSESSRV